MAFLLASMLQKDYKKEINELKILIAAQDRIYKYKLDFNDFKKLKIKYFSNLRNFSYALFCLIPFLPKIVYGIKEYLYKKKWK